MEKTAFQSAALHVYKSGFFLFGSCARLVVTLFSFRFFVMSSIFTCGMSNLIIEWEGKVYVGGCEKLNNFRIY